MSSQKSTTVRMPTRQRAVQLTVGALDRVAPSLAGRVGEFLWFRLPAPVPPRSRNRHAPSGGEGFTLSHDGLTVRGLVFGQPTGRTAYLVHGWAGYWQQLGGHVQPLVDAGFRVIVYDAPSHGDSPAGRFGPRTGRVPEAAEAHAMVVRHFGPPALTLAHSIGTMVVMWAATQHGIRTGTLVSIAGATDVPALLARFGTLIGLGPRSRPRLTRRFEKTLGHTAEDFAVPELVRRYRAETGSSERLLAIHDRADVEAPVEGSLALAAAWPDSAVLLTDGLGHRRVLWDAQVVAHVAELAAEVSRQAA